MGCEGASADRLVWLVDGSERPFVPLGGRSWPPGGTPPHASPGDARGVADASGDAGAATPDRARGGDRPSFDGLAWV